MRKFSGRGKSAFSKTWCFSTLSTSQITKSLWESRARIRARRSAFSWVWSWPSSLASPIHWLCAGTRTRWSKNLNSCNLRGSTPRQLFASWVSSHRTKTESRRRHCFVKTTVTTNLSWGSHPLTPHLSSKGIQFWQKSSPLNLTLLEIEYCRVWPGIVAQILIYLPNPLWRHPRK